MEIPTGAVGREDETIRRFTATFTASEGTAEGDGIGAPVADLLATTPADDLQAVSASDGAGLTGCILFTRLRYCAGGRGPVLLMAPVAVATAHQRRGIGQRLITQGIDRIRAQGATAAFTHGDPPFRSRRRATRGCARAGRVSKPRPPPRPRF